MMSVIIVELRFKRSVYQACVEPQTWLVLDKIVMTLTSLISILKRLVIDAR
jgi:hypothetical protein